MSSNVLLDSCGRRRSPATLSSFHRGRPPRNKGQRYPADPPTVEEIIAVMRAAGNDADAVRLRGLMVVLWRAGLRISEALALSESDLDPSRGAILVRRGKGGKRREVGMDRWAWDQLSPWLRPAADICRSEPCRPDTCRSALCQPELRAEEALCAAGQRRRQRSTSRSMPQ